MDAGKGIYTTPPNGQQTGFDFGGHLGHRGIVREVAIIQEELFFPALYGKATRDLEKAKCVYVQIARGPHQLTLGTVHAQGQGAGHAGCHL